jgi:hypothetical protein
LTIFVLENFVTKSSRTPISRVLPEALERDVLRVEDRRVACALQELRALTKEDTVMAQNGPEGNTNRSRYRDNDDARDPLEGDERLGVKPDSKTEARGDARETVGDNRRGTAAAPTGPEGNDKTRNRPIPDNFDADLNKS